MRLGWAVLMTILVMASTTAEQQVRALQLMPWPQSVTPQPGGGQLLIQNSFSVSISQSTDPHLPRAVAIFLNDLRRHTGSLPLDFKYDPSGNGQLQISADHASKTVQELGEDESYTLEIKSSAATLKAP